jgi:hypothetical protein
MICHYQMESRSFPVGAASGFSPGSHRTKIREYPTIHGCLTAPRAPNLSILLSTPEGHPVASTQIHVSGTHRRFPAWTYFLVCAMCTRRAESLTCRRLRALSGCPGLAGREFELNAAVAFLSAGEFIYLHRVFKRECSRIPAANDTPNAEAFHRTTVPA